MTVESIFDFQRFENLVEEFSEPRTNTAYGMYDLNTNPHRGLGWQLFSPREAFIAVGGFDEGYVGWGGEDADLARRYKKQAGCLIG